MLEQKVLPDNLEPYLNYSEDDLAPEGRTNHITLLYDDRTVDPPRLEIFKHIYLVTEDEYQGALRQGRLQQLLVRRRRSEIDRFLENLRFDLSSSGLQLLWEDETLVLRHAGF